MNSVFESKPIAYANLDGDIIAYNDLFRKRCGLHARPIDQLNLAALGKFSNPNVLLEAARALDTFAHSPTVRGVADSVSKGSNQAPASNSVRISAEAGAKKDVNGDEPKEWRAPLQTLGSFTLPKRGSDESFKHEEMELKREIEDAAVEDLEIVARPSTMRIFGKLCLEVTIEAPKHRHVGPKFGHYRRQSTLCCEKSEDDQKEEERSFMESLRRSNFIADRILIVDDTPKSLNTFADLVHSLGHRVVTAANGPDALDKLKNHGPFDVIFVDVYMPIMSGLDVCHEIRSQESALRVKVADRQKVIAMSSEMDASLFHECTNAGFDSFVPKPITTERFRDALQFLAERKF